MSRISSHLSRKRKQPGSYGRGRGTAETPLSGTAHIGAFKSFSMFPNRAEMTSIGRLSEHIVLMHPERHWSNVADFLEPGEFAESGYTEFQHHNNYDAFRCDDLGLADSAGTYMARTHGWKRLGMVLNMPFVSVLPSRVVTPRVPSGDPEHGNMASNLARTAVFQDLRVDPEWNFIQNTPYLWQDPASSEPQNMFHRKKMHRNDTDYGLADRAEGDTNLYYNPAEPPHFIRPRFERAWCSSVDVICNYTVFQGGFKYSAAEPTYQTDGLPTMPTLQKEGGHAHHDFSLGHAILHQQSPNNVLRIALTPFHAGHAMYNGWGIGTATNSDRTLQPDPSKALHSVDEYADWYIPANGAKLNITTENVKINRDHADLPFPVNNTTLFGFEGVSQKHTHGNVIHQQLLKRGAYSRDHKFSDLRKGISGKIKFRIVPHQFLGLQADDGECPSYDALSWRCDSDTTFCQHAVTDYQVPSGLAHPLLDGLAGPTYNFSFDKARVAQLMAYCNHEIGMHVCFGTEFPMNWGEWIILQLDYTFVRHWSLFSDYLAPSGYGAHNASYVPMQYKLDTNVSLGNFTLPGTEPLNFTI